ncbi:MAG: alpha/beta fold hydrolase [Chloroflexota bacterium]
MRRNEPNHVGGRVRTDRPGQRRGEQHDPGDVPLLGDPERERLGDLPALVVGGGLDRLFPEADSERCAEWLGAEYQPFGAHSHYGLVIGEESHLQVADTIRGFLDRHRL